MHENPYLGINAHLNSSLQAPGELYQPALWPTFHGQHITNIVESLNAQLPSHYIAFGEQSLQVRGVDDDLPPSEKPKPDVSIFQRGVGQGPVAVAEAVTPTWEAELADVVELVPQPRAAVVRELLPQRKIGRIVARIELLSPSNKPGSPNHPAYAARRAECLDERVPLVELDYLHETPPVVGLPRYPTHPDSFPYHLVVSDPRPDWSRGKVRVYSFKVGDPITKLPLPLAKDEGLVFDLDAVYQHTFQAGRWGDILDYNVEPERFATYRADDQTRIKALMTRLAV
jgi:hypothetical protein